MPGESTKSKPSRPPQIQLLGSFEGSSTVMNNSTNHVSQSPRSQQQFNAQFQNCNGYLSGTSDFNMNPANLHLNQAYDTQISSPASYLSTSNMPPSGSSMTSFAQQNPNAPRNMARSMPQNSHNMFYTSPEANQNSLAFNTIAQQQDLSQQDFAIQDNFDDASAVDFDLNDTMSPTVPNSQMVENASQQKMGIAHNVNTQHNTVGQIRGNQSMRTQMSPAPAQNIRAGTVPTQSISTAQNLTWMTPQINANELNPSNTERNQVMQRPQQLQRLQLGQANIAAQSYSPDQLYQYGDPNTAQFMLQARQQTNNNLARNIPQNSAMRRTSSGLATDPAFRQLQQHMTDRNNNAQYDMRTSQNMSQAHGMRNANTMYNNNTIHPQQQAFANFHTNNTARLQQNSRRSLLSYVDGSMNTYAGYNNIDQRQIGDVTERISSPARANSRQSMVPQSPMQGRAQNGSMQQQTPYQMRFHQTNPRQIGSTTAASGPAQTLMPHPGNHVSQNFAYGTTPQRHALVTSTQDSNKRAKNTTSSVEAAGTQFENQPRLAEHDWRTAFGPATRTAANTKRESSAPQEGVSDLGQAERPPSKRTKRAASTKSMASEGEPPKAKRSYTREPKPAQGEQEPPKPKRDYKRRAKPAQIEQQTPAFNPTPVNQYYQTTIANQIMDQIQITDDDTLGGLSGGIGGVFGNVVESVENIDPALRTDLPSNPTSAIGLTDQQTLLGLRQTPSSLVTPSQTVPVAQQPASDSAFLPSTAGFSITAPNSVPSNYNPYLVHVGVEDTTPEGRLAILNRLLGATHARNPTALPSSDHQPWNLNTPAQLPQRSSSNVRPNVHEQIQPAENSDDLPATALHQEANELDAAQARSSDSTITDTAADQSVTAEPTAAEAITTQPADPEPAIVESTAAVSASPITVQVNMVESAFDEAIAIITQQNQASSTNIEESTEQALATIDTYPYGETMMMAPDFGENDGLDALFGDFTDYQI